MMRIWKNSTMEAYYGGTLMDTIECEVRIGDGKIQVWYEGEGERLCYEGAENGQGHFTLQAIGFDGKANLHCFPDGKILDGWWAEGGEEGMWRIRLLE